MIVEDKDVYCTMLVMSKFSDNDLVAVVDSAPVGSTESTLYLNNGLDKQQRSHDVSWIIDIDSFDSPNAGIPITLGVKFRTKTIMKKTIYLLAMNNRFEFVTVRSSRTSFDIRCKDLSCT